MLILLGITRDKHSIQKQNHPVALGALIVFEVEAIAALAYVVRLHLLRRRGEMSEVSEMRN